MKLYFVIYRRGEEEDNLSIDLVLDEKEIAETIRETSYRSVLGAYLASNSGKSARFFNVCSSDVWPFNLLNCASQSVNFLVRRRIIHALSHRSAPRKDLNPFMALSRAFMCELNNSMRLVSLGQ